MNNKIYEFQAVIEPVPDKGGAYIRFPYDIRKEFGKGRVKVQATFDGCPYRGSLVNMGVKNEDSSVCYILGIRKDIREKIGKQPGDTVTVTIKEAQEAGKEKISPTAIEDYICIQPEKAQTYLRQVNETIRGAIPEAAEKISWQMPTYWKKRNLIQFAAFKKHIGLYPGPKAIEVFSDHLKAYKTSEGAIQFPYDQPLPLELIAQIAQWCEKEYGGSV